MKILESGFCSPEEVTISEYNIRKDDILSTIDGMIDSICNFGILMSIALDQESKVIDGQRRTTAVDLIRKRYGKVVPIPYVRYYFKDEAERILFSLVSNERRVQTSVEDKGKAVRQLQERGWTLEELSKASGSAISTLTSYARNEELKQELAKTDKKSAELIDDISDRKQKVLRRVLKMEPYASNVLKRQELLEKSKTMTLDQLEQLAKDVVNKVPIDIESRSSRTIDKTEYSQMVFYPKKKTYKLATQRCAAEGLDIKSVVIALFEAWAKYELDIEV